MQANDIALLWKRKMLYWVREQDVACKTCEVIHMLDPQLKHGVQFGELHYKGLVEQLDRP